jgi:hypothetical protein
MTRTVDRITYVLLHGLNPDDYPEGLQCLCKCTCYSHSGLQLLFKRRMCSCFDCK